MPLVSDPINQVDASQVPFQIAAFRDTDTDIKTPKVMLVNADGTPWTPPGGGGLSGDRLINLGGAVPGDATIVTNGGASAPFTYTPPDADLSAETPVFHTSIGNYVGPTDDFEAHLPSTGGVAHMVTVASVEAASVTLFVGGDEVQYVSTVPVAAFEDQVTLLLAPEATGGWAAYSVFPYQAADVFVTPGSVLTTDDVAGQLGQAEATFVSHDGRLDAVETPTVGTGLAGSGTVDLDLAALNGTVQWITATGNITFTTSNRAAGRSVRVFIDAGGSSRTLAYPAWIPQGAALPTTLASGKRLALSLFALDGTDANISAAAAVQP